MAVHIRPAGKSLFFANIPAFFACVEFGVGSAASEFFS
jgi:hypothetical protein